MSGGPTESEEAPRASSRVERAAAMLSRLGGVVSSILILAVLLVTAVSVFNRYVLGKPLTGVDEGTGFLVVAIVMFGAAEALRRGDHIRIDIVFDAARPAARWWLELWSCASVVIFAVLLLVTSWHTVLFSRAFGAYSSGYLSMPMWIPQSTMVLGAVLLGLAAVAATLRLVAERPK